VANELSTNTEAGPPPEIEFDFPGGLGITRSTGDVIALLLNFETPEQRAQILAWVAKGMRIPLADLVKEYEECDL
jgi:hypothetical protein